MIPWVARSIATILAISTISWETIPWSIAVLHASVMAKSAVITISVWAMGWGVLSVSVVVELLGLIGG